jgi:hypothetical protein
MFWIVLSIIFFLLLGASIFLNYRLFVEHTKLVAFFDKEAKINEEDYEFIDKMANMNLLLMDNTIKIFHTKVKAVRDRYEEYVKSGNFPKS